jgi:hypothetical protein
MSTDPSTRAIRKLSVVPGHDEPHGNLEPVGEVLYRREKGAIDRTTVAEGIGCKSEFLRAYGATSHGKEKDKGQH